MTLPDIEKLLKQCSYRQQYIKSIALDVRDEFFQFDAYANIIEQALDNTDWPLAVDPPMIVTTNDDKVQRSENIISVFAESLKNKRVLDYGCGEGHLIQSALREATFALGYDIKPIGHPNTTHDKTVVDQNAPYDAVFLYDVLDHSTDPIAILKHIAAVTHPESMIYVRCHPWCARHGGHLFKTINRAYFHYFISDELGRLISPDYPTQKVIHPLGTYGNWFSAAGLKIKSEEPIQTTPEPFFYALADTIKSHWATSPLAEFAEGRIFPAFPMSIEFVDFTLTHQQA